MAKRLTDTDIWDKEWFMHLSPKLKCLVRFVWDKCDLSGTWNPNWTLAKLYIGEDVNEGELLTINGGLQFVKLPSNKIYCLDFIDFQNGKLSHKSPIHIKILSLLEKNGIPYPYPINRVSGSLIVDVVVGVEVEEKPKITEKIKVRDNVTLSSQEIETLKTKYTTEELDWMYDKLYTYKLSTGKEYSSDYGTILSWVADSLRRKKEKALKEEKKENKGRNHHSGIEAN